MMNGMGLVEIAQRWLPNARFYQASTTHGALFTSRDINTNQPCLIRHTGYGETKIGSLSKIQPPDSKILSIVSLLDKALAPFEWNTGHLETLWTKLLINSIINPITAVFDVNNGALISDKELKLKAENLAIELGPVINHYLPQSSYQQILDTALKVADKTNENSSSMRQDINQGRKTEIDFISGYILKKAHEIGCSLPKHQQIVNQVKELEMQTLNSVTK